MNIKQLTLIALLLASPVFLLTACQAENRALEKAEVQPNKETLLLDYYYRLPRNFEFAMMQGEVAMSDKKQRQKWIEEAKEAGHYRLEEKNNAMSLQAGESSHFEMQLFQHTDGSFVAVIHQDFHEMNSELKLLQYKNEHWTEVNKKLLPEEVLSWWKKCPTGYCESETSTGNRSTQYIPALLQDGKKIKLLVIQTDWYEKENASTEVLTEYSLPWDGTKFGLVEELQRTQKYKAEDE